jgi:hypothetical protein
MPKKYFHDVLANHVDYGFASEDGNESVHKSGNHCGFDQKVAVSPCTIVSSFSELAPPVAYKCIVEPVLVLYLPTANFQIENKGPPFFTPC